MSAEGLIGVLLVTHGRLGEDLAESARQIVGDIPHVSFVTIGWNDEVEASRERISEGIRSVNLGRGVIVLTDMFGGTPSNLALPFLQKDSVEIVTGVNLPMVIKVASQTGDETLLELTHRVRDQGQRHISVASEVLGE